MGMRSNSGITRHYFFRMKAEPLRVDEAIITYSHVQQRDARLFAGDSVRPAHNIITAMLTLITHV